jgi:hypothetical protein
MPRPLTDADLATLRQKLEECHEWPCEYTFKFIVPQDRVNQLLAVLDKTRAKTRPSRNGRWVSVTFTVTAQASEEIIMIYQKASRVPDIISL